MELTDLYLAKLSRELIEANNSFDCGDSDINDFLQQDALNFEKEKIANTYVFHDEDLNIVAFFAICNDCLNDKGAYESKTWNKLHRKIKLPNQKRIKQYPSVKIARLGIDLKHQGIGLSHQILDFIKGWTFIEFKPACRLLILDAYNKEKQLSVYLKNDFVFLHDKDINDKHRFMYFDLLRLE
jgi:hypothetical protein